MKGLVIAASLATWMSAAPAFAQSAGQPKPAAPTQTAQPKPATPAAQAPKPAAPAPQQPAAPAAPAMQQPPQPPAPFPQGAKIAYFNIQRVANESADGKASTQKVQALIQKKQNEAGDRTKTLQANQQKLQTSGGVMSDAARSQLEKEIEKSQVDAQRFQQDAQAEVNELQQELQNEFQKKLFPIVQQVAQEKGLQLLLSQADAGIVWADPGLDLTDEIVKKLDAKPATTKP